MKMSLKNNINRLSIGGKIGFVVIVGILFSTYPYVFNLILPLPSITILMLVSFVLFVCAAMMGVVKPYSKLLPLCMVQVFGTLVSLVQSSDTEYFKQVTYIIWGFFMISFINCLGVKRFLFYYDRMILGIALLGVISSVLTMLFGEHVIMTFREMDGRTGALVYGTFTNIFGNGFIRYAGIFDEPGAMAFWGMFVLVFNKIYVKDKVIEVPLIICLLFTFSLAFIIQVFLYLLFYYLMQTTIKVKVLATFLATFLVFGAYLLMDKNSPIYFLTFGRLGIGTSYNMMHDSSRAILTEMAKKTFLSNPMFGIGPTRFYMGQYMADNPYETLAKDGIIGSFFIYLPMFIAFIRGYLNKNILYAAFILSVGYLQRPFHINIQHYTMLFIFLIITWKLTAIKSLKQ